MCGAGKTYCTRLGTVWLALGNTGPWQLNAVPQTRVSLLPTVCDESFAINGSVGMKGENQGREKGKGMQLFGVTILPLNGEQFPGQQRMRWGKKGLLNSYGTDTNTSNIPRPVKGFVKILQVKKCMREFWHCLIFCVHKVKMDDAIPSQWLGFIWRVTATRKGEKEEPKREVFKWELYPLLIEWWLQGVFEGCRSTDVRTW